MPRHHYTFAQKTCVSKAGLLLQKTASLWPHCRVGIAVSGGMDSFVLAKVMKIRQTITPFKFEIMVLHCNPGFQEADHESLSAWLSSEGIPFHIEVNNYGPYAHSEKNQKNSPCFLCARERRKRLFSLAQQYGLTHLALGHNADDLLSTFIMNFMRNGRVQGMTSAEAFFNGRLQLIRPLLLVEKKFIRQAARQWNLPYWENSCPSSGKTARSQTGEIIENILKILPDAKNSMLGALTRWQVLEDINHKGDEAKSH